MQLTKLLIKTLVEDVGHLVPYQEPKAAGFWTKANSPSAPEKLDGQFTPESDDPFTELDTGACHFSKHPHIGGIKGYVQLTPEDEEELLSFVAHYRPKSAYSKLVGKNWGEEGYIRMIRGINTCGVSSRVYSVYYDNE